MDINRKTYFAFRQLMSYTHPSFSVKPMIRASLVLSPKYNKESIFRCRILSLAIARIYRDCYQNLIHGGCNLLFTENEGWACGRF